MSGALHPAVIDLPPPPELPPGVAYGRFSSSVLEPFHLPQAEIPDYQFLPYKKVGILPYIIEEELLFLCARPRPTKQEDTGRTMPYQMARGCPCVWNTHENQWTDLRHTQDWQQAKTEGFQSEPSILTTLREGEEELGVVPSNILRWLECGVVRYKDYGILLSALQLRNKNDLLPAPDSASVGWLTVKQMQELATANDFKTGYLPIITAIEKLLKTSLR